MDDIKPTATNSEQVVTEPANMDAPQSEAPAGLDTQGDQNSSSVNDAAPAANTALKPKHGPMTAVVAIVILVILALGVVGYFAFVKKDSDKPATTSQSQTTTTPTVSKADPDTTSQTIDTTINKLDDTKDYNASDLSDATLGL